MDLIIDGYNLLHAVGIHAPRRGPQNLEGARGVLLQFLTAALSNEALRRQARTLRKLAHRQGSLWGQWLWFAGMRMTRSLSR